MQVKLIEIEGLRAVYGNDESAINRHSVRTYVITDDSNNYQERGWAIHLDRVLDQIPVGFVATEVPYRSSHGLSVPMNMFLSQIECDAIEDCTTWHQVEKKMKDILIALDSETFSDDIEVVIERSDAELDNWHCFGIKPKTAAVA